jgi:hypothetical protein
MKFNYKKISAIAVSALMTGMTLGVAAAANYPAPFVSGGVANVAVVYGTGAGVSSLDLVQAGNIQDSLGEFVTGGTVTVEGGEAFTLEKSSNNFNFQNALNGVYSELDDEDMDFLADGTYKDGTVDEDYSQEISPSTKKLVQFADSDYNDDEPTIGFWWENGENILMYNLTYDDGIPFEDLEDTDLPLLGNTYYVLDVPIANTSIVLLDSADKIILNEGESKTVGDKTVSIEYISLTQVKFNVDGEITDKLLDHEYEELSDGSYIVANEIMYNEKEVGISSVEFSIGAGKITLKTGEDVEVNDEDVDGLVVSIGGQGTSEITGLHFAWNSDDNTFVTVEDAATMPVFGAITVVLDGITFPTDSETISLDDGEQMTLEMGNYDLPLFWFDKDSVTNTQGYLGEEGYKLITKTATLAANYTNVTGTTRYARNGNRTGGLSLEEDQRFLITTVDDDLSDTDTYYYEVNKIDSDGTLAGITIELNDLIGTKDVLFDDADDTPTAGDLTFNMIEMNDTHAYLVVEPASGVTLAYNRAVSDTGLVTLLPANASLIELDFADGVTLTFSEADKDGDLLKGYNFTTVVKNTSNNKLHPASYSLTAYDEETTTDDVFVAYTPSDLASKVTYDTSADENTLDIEYYGEEVTADVQVVGGASTISQGDSTLGNVLVKDSEVGNVATKGLIVVGGSCINSAAAALVGGAKCGAAWTEATGIGSGQFLIKGYADSTITSGLALLVAGYDAEDTVKATTYLTNKVVDTSKAYKGTTTTETAVVID